MSEVVFQVDELAVHSRKVELSDQLGQETRVATYGFGEEREVKKSNGIEMQKKNNSRPSKPVARNNTDETFAIIHQIR